MGDLSFIAARTHNALIFNLAEHFCVLKTSSSSFSRIVCFVNCVFVWIAVIATESYLNWSDSAKKRRIDKNELIKNNRRAQRETCERNAEIEKEK